MQETNPELGKELNRGHRERLRKRLLEGGGDQLLDHEVIEYLLALAIPRRDTKPLAKQLINHLGGISGLLTADAETLLKQPGMGETSAAAIKIIQTAALRLISAPIHEMPILASWQALLDYLRADMAHLKTERVRTLFLDTKNRLIRIANWMAKEMILKRIQENCRYSIQANLEEGKQTMLTYLNNYAPMPGVFVNGTMEDIEFQKVQLTNNAILAFLSVKGNISVTVAGLK